MPSRSRLQWENERRRALDDIEAAHVASRGDRRRSDLLKQAYAVMLSAHFQAFCRSLHAEAVDHLATNLQPPPLRDLLRERLLTGRKLDSGNPNAGNIGSDFDRLGLRIWPALIAHRSRTQAHRAGLDELNAWRNAIAHQDYKASMLGGRTALRLTDLRRWRSACESLVRSMEALVRAHLLTLVHAPPWR